MPYPYLPPAEEYPSIRVTLPNRIFDPQRGNQLYHKYLDIYRACDELGLDVFLNEHHQTATCVDSVAPLALAIVARETRRARLLFLGNPVANRDDPIRVAEEMAFVDVISGGRLECGLVRGVPQEILPSNANPVDNKARFWEATDLIIKAWTSHEGPFSWESEFYNKRAVNIWPRPLQQPHPPIWITTLSGATAAEIADRQYVMATILCGAEMARKMFDTYRQHSVEVGLPAPGPDKVAYCGLAFVGENDAEVEAGIEKLRWYVATQKVAHQFVDPPGYSGPEVRVKWLRETAKGESHPSLDQLAKVAAAPAAELIEKGMFFAGTPDQVVDQIKRFYREVGGFDNFLAMMHCGDMSYQETYKSLKLYAEKVQPRLRAELPELLTRVA
jgi:alkanesulfonate monooxygenase SsuD/methylene tetrahydromethanopterin reductase-like flavin-dependent oxidoreductase (luciferase family)